jgi:hypothetical protein
LKSSRELSLNVNHSSFMTNPRLLNVCLSAAAALLLVPASGAQAANLVFTAPLSAETTDIVTPATGFTTVTYDSAAHTLRVQATFSGLLGPTTVAHIHAPTAVPGAGTIGVATQVPTFPGFPAGVTAGTYDATFDMTESASFNPAFITNFAGGDPAAAEATLVAALLEGRAYLNIHTTEYPGGEIRGFLARSVPEPGTGLASALVLLGLAGLTRLRPRSL